MTGKGRCLSQKCEGKGLAENEDGTRRAHGVLTIRTHPHLHNPKVHLVSYPINTMWASIPNELPFICSNDYYRDWQL